MSYRAEKGFTASLLMYFNQHIMACSSSVNELSTRLQLSSAVSCHPCLHLVSLLSARWWCCSDWRSIRPTQIRDESGEKEDGRVTWDQIKRKSAWSDIGGGVAGDREGGNKRKFNISQTRNLYTPMRVWNISSALSNLASSVKEPVFYQHKGALDSRADTKLNSPLLSQR